MATFKNVVDEWMEILTSPELKRAYRINAVLVVSFFATYGLGHFLHIIGS